MVGVHGGGATLAAAAAARAGLPLLLTAPAPHQRSWPALALYPHPDVLAQVCAASRIHDTPLFNTFMIVEIILN